MYSRASLHRYMQMGNKNARFDCSSIWGPSARSGLARLRRPLRRGSEITRRLKRCGRLVDKALQSGKRADGNRCAAEAAALALHLEADLRHWPKLSRRNLHEFRLKVKELRYVLQMAADTNHEFVSTLGDVQDAIGEWHDWEVLAAIANEVIQHPGCKLLKEIRSIARDKFDHGLELANSMRKKDLAVKERNRRQRSSTKSLARVNQSALISASALAA